MPGRGQDILTQQGKLYIAIANFTQIGFKECDRTVPRTKEANTLAVVSGSFIRMDHLKVTNTLTSFADLNGAGPRR